MTKQQSKNLLEKLTLYIDTFRYNKEYIVAEIDIYSNGAVAVYGIDYPSVVTIHIDRLSADLREEGAMGYFKFEVKKLRKMNHQGIIDKAIDCHKKVMDHF